VNGEQLNSAAQLAGSYTQPQAKPPKPPLIGPQGPALNSAAQLVSAIPEQPPKPEKPKPMNEQIGQQPSFRPYAPTPTRDLDRASKIKSVWAGVITLAIYLFMFVVMPLLQAYQAASPFLYQMNRAADDQGIGALANNIESAYGSAIIQQQILSAWPGLIVAVVVGFLVRWITKPKQTES
jgi:hypothetical protein